MDELQRRIAAQARTLDLEYELLEPLLDGDVTEETVRLHLSQAKRVGREVRVLVQALAQLRDNLQP